MSMYGLNSSENDVFRDCDNCDLKGGQHGQFLKSFRYVLPILV